MFCDSNATKLEVLERSHLVIWLDSIFWSLAVWVAEKIPKLWRKDQPFASNVSTNTARDATLRSVVFAVVHQRLLTAGFVWSKHIRSSSLQNLFCSLFIAYSAKSSIPRILFCFGVAVIRDDQTSYGKHASMRSRIV